MKLNTLLFSFFGLLLLGQGQLWAQSNDPLADIFSDQPEFLPVEQAFRFDFNQQQDKLTISFEIAEGYYLYKKQFKNR